MRTAEKDQNYLSLNRDSVVWFAGTPEEHQGSIPDPLHLAPADPKAWDTILKCSDRHDTRVYDVMVAQGKENAFDANNGTSNCEFHGEWGVIGNEGEQVFTIKGGVEDLTLSGTVFSRGTDCDIEVGAWSDQSTRPSYNLDLSGLSHSDGKPLTFVFGRVKMPIFALFGRPSGIKLPPGSKVMFWGSLAEMSYWWIKLVLVKTGLIKIVKI